MAPPHPRTPAPPTGAWRLRGRPLLTWGLSVPRSAASCSRSRGHGPDRRAALAIARVDGRRSAGPVPRCLRGTARPPRPPGGDSAPGWASWVLGPGRNLSGCFPPSLALPIALTPASPGHPARDGSELSWERHFPNGGPYGEFPTCQVLYQVLLHPSLTH